MSANTFNRANYIQEHPRVRAFAVHYLYDHEYLILCRDCARHAPLVHNQPIRAIENIAPGTYCDYCDIYIEQ